MIKVVRADVAGSGQVVFKPSEGGQISVGLDERVPSSLSGSLWELDAGGGSKGRKTAADVLAQARSIQSGGTLIAYQVA